MEGLAKLPRLDTQALQFSEQRLLEPWTCSEPQVRPRPRKRTAEAIAKREVPIGRRQCRNQVAERQERTNSPRDDKANEEVPGEDQYKSADQPVHGWFVRLTADPRGDRSCHAQRNPVIQIAPECD